MASENELHSCLYEEPNHDYCYLKKFKLYETRSNFYMIGRDKSRCCWRVLKIDRFEPFELNIIEDPTTYSENECHDLLRRIHEGNKAVGGLKLVTICYGIIGFVRFLGPYYMLVITKRRKLGTICGHTIYGISKSKMIPVPNSSVRSNLPYSKDENRYKKLLCTVDLTKDFYFSYSYHVMRSLQKNLNDYKAGDFLYETMFVWNEYLTRGIRNNLKNTLWTVALVHGFFKQVDLSVSGRDFKLTLIARRSRHYAGTRYLKRGINEKGRVANDVETEQIIIENAPEGCAMQISSVVQIRGSIPLFWSQETSRINIKPDIILSRKDQNYEATRLHFENLFKRYGNPIIILNLIKMREKKPRETILRAEFAKAVRFINRSLTKENHLKFIQWDLHKHSRSKASNVLVQLAKMATYVLSVTGIFYCQVAPNLRPLEFPNVPCFEKKDSDDCSSENLSSQKEDAYNLKIENCNGGCGASGRNYNDKPLMFQKGVLRTNCIDCLDRTNVAQYAYGLVALGNQLHTLGFTESKNISLDDPLAIELMKIYETMGDTLAFQYGGSAAHNKIFSERRGQWKPATQSQELIRTLQRYCNNAYWDRDKQDAINVCIDKNQKQYDVFVEIVSFLGHFQPQLGKPALWELDSDQHYNVGRRDCNFSVENVRSVIKRSLSDGNILCESDTPEASTLVGRSQPSSENGINEGLSDSLPLIPSCENDISCFRYTHSMSQKKFTRFMQEEHFLERDHISYDEHDEFNFSNFMDADWLSSSGNSCEEETNERFLDSVSLETVTNDSTNSASNSGSIVKEDDHTNAELGLGHGSGLAEFPGSFANWVSDGGLLFR